MPIASGVHRAATASTRTGTVPNRTHAFTFRRGFGSTVTGTSSSRSSAAVRVCSSPPRAIVRYADAVDRRMNDKALIKIVTATADRLRFGT